jgi:hypothetical protein
MAQDIGVLAGALPLIRGDNPWEQPVVFWDDEDKTVALDLTDKSVKAEMRLPAATHPVTVTVTDAEAGAVLLSLTGEQTQGLPFGRLVTLFVQVVDGAETVTWFRAAVDVKEGLDS